MRNKIGLISCYYGKLPSYFSFFLKSCSNNLDFYFLLFTDQPVSNFSLPPNVEVFNSDLKKFNELASVKLGFRINLSRGYKLCDFKPAYGLIFEEYLRDFDYWGGTDLDIIFGNLKIVFNDQFLEQYDYISSIKQYTSGSFFIFKNSALMNRIFMESRDYQKVFQDEKKSYAFDECALYWKELKNGINLVDLNTEIISLSHIVFDKIDKGEIKAFFGDLNAEPYGIEEWIIYDHGKLSVGAIEVPMVHLIFLKTKYYFIIPNWQTIPDRFFIRGTGIYKVGTRIALNYWFSTQRWQIIRTKISNIVKKTFFGLQSRKAANSCSNSGLLV